MRSPLAEGRELKCDGSLEVRGREASPLAEGRELKFFSSLPISTAAMSPLAEGRELKWKVDVCNDKALTRRPSRRGVN